MILFKPKSVKAALVSLYGRRVLGTEPNRFIDDAAVALNLTSSEVLAAVAKVLQLPSIETVSACALETLPATIKLSQLWEDGIIPITKGVSVVGWIVAEPDIFRKKYPQFRTTPIFLSTRERISAALRDTEASNQEPKPSDPFYAALLGVMVEEAIEAGAHSVQFKFLGKRAEYQFVNAENRIAIGSIDERVIDSFFCFLKNLPQEFCDYALPSGKSPLPLTISRIGYEFSVLLLREQLVLAPAVLPANVVRFPSTPPVSGITEEIVCIDDDPTFIKVTERFIRKLGLSTRVFGGGIDALSFFATAEVLPSVILCDVHMPDYFGVDLIRDIKNLPGFHTTIIIALSADEHSETTLALLNAGAELVLSKRGDPRILSHYLKKFVVPHRKVAAR